MCARLSVLVGLALLLAGCSDLGLGEPEYCKAGRSMFDASFDTFVEALSISPEARPCLLAKDDAQRRCLQDLLLRCRWVRDDMQIIQDVRARD
jgi:hypothetical protein